jgi:hypothetical protein
MTKINEGTGVKWKHPIMKEYGVKGARFYQAPQIYLRSQEGLIALETERICEEQHPE